MKINYKKRYDHDGTVYNQTIKIDKWLKEYYNNYLLKLKTDVDNRYLTTHTYSTSGLTIKGIEYLKNDINYTKLTQLDILLQVINELNRKGYNFDFKRILWRNTVIEVF